MLLELGREHDDGFGIGMFTEQLSRVATYLPSEAAVYGVGQDAFLAVKSRLLAWASKLRERNQPLPDRRPGGPS